MHPVFYYIIVSLAIGGAGMAWANRKAAPAVRRQRWLKYFTYIFITGTIILGMFFHFFYWIAWIIVFFSSIELLRVNRSDWVNIAEVAISFLIFSAVATGFILFAKTFNTAFLLFIYFPVLVFDGFCQISGQLFGKTPLARRISPAKTVEGFIGGWLCCIVVSWLAASWLPGGQSLKLFGLSCGILSGMVSLAGDLAASYYKRKAGIKDFSNWLPGQGGFLDRFDSFLLTGAVYYFLYLLIFKDGFVEFIKQVPK